MGFLAGNGQTRFARRITWTFMILVGLAAAAVYMTQDRPVQQAHSEDNHAASHRPLPAAPPQPRVLATPPVKTPTPTPVILPVPKPPKPTPRKRPTSLSPDELFRFASPAVVQVLASMKNSPADSQGSGFFVSADGLLVTNFHCIQGARNARIVTADGRRFVVKGVLAYNAKADLALLKVSGRVKTYLSLAKDRPPRVGTRVFAIGNPKGLTNTLSDGMISGLRAMAGEVHFLQTTAPISQGSSGGPLLTADGKVVGVTTATYTDGQNLNLAVPAAEVRILINGRGRLQSIADVSGGQRLERAPANMREAVRKALMVKDGLRTASPMVDKLLAAYRNDPYVWYLSAIRWELWAIKTRDDSLFDRAYADYRTVYKLAPDSNLGRKADKRMYNLRIR